MPRAGRTQACVLPAQRTDQHPVQTGTQYSEGQDKVKDHHFRQG